MRYARAAALVVLASCLAACGGGNGAGDTSATPIKSPSASPSLQPTVTPTPSPTVTSTPEMGPPVTPGLAAQVMREAESSICWFFPGYSSVSGATVICDAPIGHYGSVTLVGFADEGSAVQAFGDESTFDEYLEGQLAVHESPSVIYPIGTDLRWRWQRGCWLITGSAFHDTIYGGPRAHDSVRAIVAVADRYQLFSRCLSAPSDEP